jgi:hypothetical protein
VDLVDQRKVKSDLIDRDQIFSREVLQDSSQERLRKEETLGVTLDVPLNQ